MLQWFRNWASTVAIATIASLTVVGASAVVPHDDDCHDACAVAVDHDASAHRVSAAAVDEESHPIHCLVCHWIRAFRHRSETRTLAAPTAARAGSIVVRFVPISAGAPVAQPPLRSPPSLQS